MRGKTFENYFCVTALLVCSHAESSGLKIFLCEASIPRKPVFGPFSVELLSAKEIVPVETAVSVL